jgi:transposase-like protein
MLKKGHSEEQILRALRQAEEGAKVSEICREVGISDAILYLEEEVLGTGIERAA